MNGLREVFKLIVIQTLFQISVSSLEGQKNVLHEKWLNVPGYSIDDLLKNTRYQDRANETWYETQMMDKPIRRNNFGSRHRSYFLAPETGNYTFYTSCDDTCRLYVSPDINPSNKQRIVDQNRDVTHGVWTQRESQRSDPRYLKKGHIYYMECLFKQKLSSSHMAVGMTTPSGENDKPISSKHFRSTVSGLHLPGVNCKKAGDYRFPNYHDCSYLTPTGKVNATLDELKALQLKLVNISKYTLADLESILEDGAVSVNLLLASLNDSDAAKGLKHNSMGFEVAGELEILGERIIRHFNNSFTLKYPELEMSGQAVNGLVKFPNESNSSIDQIELKFKPSSGRHHVFMIHYQNLDRAVQIDGISVKSKRVKDVKEKYFLNSRIISASLVPGIQKDVLEEVTVRLEHNRFKKAPSYEAMCGFWDFGGRSKSSRTGSWSSYGCSKDESLSDDKFTVCRCTHLTNFGILMKVSNTEEDIVHKKALGIITYVGCALSLVGEALTILVMTSLRLTKSETNVIHLNLVSSLALAQIIFLAGIEATGHKVACKVVAVFLHYFNLVAFVWMLVEGVWLYLMVVKVFDDGRSRLRKYIACAWGIPFVFVIITLAASFDGYGTETSCWLSVQKGTIWSFVVPVLLIIISNSIILTMVLREIVKLHQPACGENTELTSARAAFKSAAVLLPLLGIAWVFGILTFNKDTVVFQYLFALFNSLQGFFIFLFYCVLNSEVRKAFLRKKQVWSESHVQFQTHSLSLQKEDKDTLTMADGNQRPGSGASSTRSIGWQ